MPTSSLDQISDIVEMIAVADPRSVLDIGVAHQQERWILDRFGGTDREGFRDLGMGVRHLKNLGHVDRVPGFVLRSALGRVAYFVGRRHRRLPRSLCRRLSSFSTWWDRPDAAGDVPTRIGQ